MHYIHRLSPARMHQIVGWFVIVPVLILGAVLFVVAKNENLFEEKYRMTTVFSEGFGLKVGYPVMLLGIQVGRISGIEFTDQNDARFTLSILKKYQDKIRTNSKAKIEKSGGFFGDPHIAITPGNKSNPMVADGGHIESEDQLDIAAEAKSMLEEVKKTLTRVDDITKDVQGTIKSGQDVVTSVKQTTDRLPQLMNDVGDTVDSIKQTSLKLSKDIPPMTGSLQKTINQAGKAVEEVRSSLAQLPEAVDNLTKSTAAVKGIVDNDVPPLVRSAQGAMDDVNEVLVGAKKTFPISIFAEKGKAARSEEEAAAAASGLRSLRMDELTKE